MGEKNIVKTIVLVESVLFLIALVWGYFASINPFNTLKFNLDDFLIAFVFTLILLLFNFFVLNILSKYLTFFEKLKEAYESVIPIVSNIGIKGAFVIAVFSSIAEEFFFRGILQNQFGLIIASIVFGVFHIGSRKTIYYGVYTVFMGIFLGYMYLKTQNLAVPIIIHGLNNFVAVPYMKYYYKRYMQIE